jgi:hypothetical protein
MTKRAVEVRCCCTPNKVLGYLPVPGALEVGKRVVFVLDTARSDAWVLGLRLEVPETFPTITFEVARWSESRIRELPAIGVVGFELERTGGLALKHENVTLEELRRIDGFVEAQS